MARQEDRTKRRINGYLRTCFEPAALFGDHLALPRLKNINTALAQARQGERRDNGRRHARGQIQTDAQAAERKAEKILLDLCLDENQELERIQRRVNGLSQTDFEALKSTFWRCMNRCCGKFSNREVLDLRPGMHRPWLRALLCEAGGKTPIENPDAAHNFSATPLKSRVLYYSAALAEPVADDEDKCQVADVLNMLFDYGPRLLERANDLDWNHVIMQAVRSYPLSVGEQLAERLVEDQPMIYSTEQMKRLVLELLKRVKPFDRGPHLETLGGLIAELATNELKHCVQESEKAHIALTVPKVMVKSLINPGWMEIMGVWANDPHAGRYLCCNHGVSVLLQCLERNPGMFDKLVDHSYFMQLQNKILWRFVCALNPQHLTRTAYISALAWTIHEQDIWTKKQVRRRLGEVIKNLVWDQLKIRLPGKYQHPLGKVPQRAEEGLSLALPPSEGDPVHVRIHAAPPGFEDHLVQLPKPDGDDCSQNYDEVILTLLEGARLVSEPPPLDGSWLSSAREGMRGSHAVASLNSLDDDVSTTCDDRQDSDESSGCADSDETVVSVVAAPAEEKGCKRVFFFPPQYVCAGTDYFVYNAELAEWPFQYPSPCLWS